MAKNNKKKPKAYYDKKITTKPEEKNDKQLMSNSSFVMGLGFLIWMYSRYVSRSSYTMLTALLGLGVMLYGVILNLKKDRESGKEMTTLLKVADYGMIFVVAIALIFYLVITVKSVSKM